jgi:two-component system, cell cycle response regulator
MPCIARLGAGARLTSACSDTPADALFQVSSNGSRLTARLVRASHEAWDGTGYPDRPAGVEIPLGARIIAICDSFDAMISARPYAPPKTIPEALAELRRCAGTQFAPTIVEVFEQVIASRG